MTIYGISGYRTPAHSVAVGGFADDPHTKGEAEDIGVGSLLRSSAAQISEAELARFGLYRPFDPTDDPNNTEVNHIQLIPSGVRSRSSSPTPPTPRIRAASERLIDRGGDSRAAPRHDLRHVLRGGSPALATAPSSDNPAATASAAVNPSLNSCDEP